jgi:hypothetical protein
MISKQRINELKRYSDHRKFFDAVLCEMSIVRQHREVFEAKAREFGNKCLEYSAACNERIKWEAVDKAIKAAKERKDIKVLCATPFKPPKDNCKRINIQIEKDGLSFPWHLWAPPDFPDDPINWFIIYSPSHYHDTGRLYEELLELKATCPPKDMLLRDYVTIACLFNKGAEERGEIPILPEILSGIDIQQEYEINIYNHLWPKVKAAFIRALEAISDDLAKPRMAETVQKEISSPILLPNYRYIKGYVRKIETPKELLDFLEDGYERIYDSSIFGNEHSFFYIISECAVRIRKKYLSLNLPKVPIVDNIMAYKDWCVSALQILDESNRTKPNLASTKQNDKKVKLQSEDKTPEQCVGEEAFDKLYEAARKSGRCFPEKCDVGVIVPKYPFKDGFANIYFDTDMARKIETDILDYNDLALLGYIFDPQAKEKWRQSLSEAKAQKIPFNEYALSCEFGRQVKIGRFLNVGKLKAYLRRNCNVQEPGLSGIGWPDILKHLRLYQEEQQPKTDLVSTKQNGEKTVPQIIDQGEGHTVEFKETLEYDVKTDNNSKDVLLSSLKTIAGFLNADGGTLLIGVNDSGEIKGIERDLSTMKHSNNDRFEQKIRSCMRDRFNPQPIGKVSMLFEKFAEGTICRVDVQANKEVVHLDGDIYVREGNTTQKLEGRHRTDWIQQRVK